MKVSNWYITSEKTSSGFFSSVSTKTSWIWGYYVYNVILNLSYFSCSWSMYFYYILSASPSLALFLILVILTFVLLVKKMITLGKTTSLRFSWNNCLISLYYSSLKIPSSNIVLEKISNCSNSTLSWIRMLLVYLKDFSFLHRS